MSVKKGINCLTFPCVSRACFRTFEVTLRGVGVRSREVLFSGNSASRNHGAFRFGIKIEPVEVSSQHLTSELDKRSCLSMIESDPGPSKRSYLSRVTITRAPSHAHIRRTMET